MRAGCTAPRTGREQETNMSRTRLSRKAPGTTGKRWGQRLTRAAGALGSAYAVVHSFGLTRSWPVWLCTGIGLSLWLCLTAGTWLRRADRSALTGIDAGMRRHARRGRADGPGCGIAAKTPAGASLATAAIGRMRPARPVPGRAAMLPQAPLSRFRREGGTVRGTGIAYAEARARRAVRSARCRPFRHSQTAPDARASYWSARMDGPRCRGRPAV